MKIKVITTKVIFKRAMKAFAEIFMPKAGFAVPLSRWFRGQLGRLFETCFFPKSVERGIFRKSYIERLIE